MHLQLLADELERNQLQKLGLQPGLYDISMRLTLNEQRHHSLTLMAKSRTYTITTAKRIVRVFVADEFQPTPKMDRKPATISLAQANKNNDTVVDIAPPMMNGRLLPYLDLQLSLLRPTYGWTRVPERGPAIQTSASRDLLRPRDKRYGYGGKRQWGRGYVGNDRSTSGYSPNRMTIQPTTLSVDCRKA